MSRTYGDELRDAIEAYQKVRAMDDAAWEKMRSAELALQEARREREVLVYESGPVYARLEAAQNNAANHGLDTPIQEDS